MASSRDALHVAFVTPEMVPFMKTGGLADVSAALPKALGKLGHRVTVLLPRHGPIPLPTGELVGSAPLVVDGGPRQADFYRVVLGGGVEVVLIEHAPFFDRPQPYGVGNRDHPDNAFRFAFLARASLEYFRLRRERPDVFHAQDWQSGLVPVYLKAFYWSDPVLGRAASVFTIHNLAYQGNFPLTTLIALGLPSHLAGVDELEFHGRVSYLKGGIVFAEMVSTVSPRYAQEIQTPALGYGFDGILRSRGGDLVGILNGVDYEEWDPRVDPHIARRYDSRSLAGKAVCKTELQRELGLAATPDLPLVGVISRLVPQKGFDIVVGAGPELLERPLQLAVLGTGEQAVQDGFRALAAADPARFAARFAYDSALAHRIEAGADMFLMPSRDEPCGLTQMYSLRYGTPPIVRATGGLVDTVEPWDAATGQGTGFRFRRAAAADLLSGGIDPALVAWADRRGWQRLMRNGMAKDFSWDRSARAYVELYRRAIAKA